MQRTFYPPHWRNRPINIKIGQEYITFHFKNEDDREFYHIPKEEWIRDKQDEGRKDRPDNWEKHMGEKVYFTSDIRKFINDSLGLVDCGKRLRQDEWTEIDQKIRDKAIKNGGVISISDMEDVLGKDGFKNYLLES